jgi:demethylmenaquinone methyltransferase/2-methoxy-6-polyprenyl-1,4-benzoquinol methylase
MAKTEDMFMNEQEYMENMRQYFDELAPVWDDICHHDESKLRLICHLASPTPGSRLLDIGCGAGVMIEPLLATDPGELLALDISPRMIDQAAQKYRDARLRLLARDFFALDESGFDFALFYSAYPHFSHKKELARQTAHCLKSNGRFMIAHSESRAIINNRHQSSAVAQLSQPLKAAAEEAETWRLYFTVDMLIDTERLYIISGRRE